jgi:hypothetical protein
MNDVNLEKKLCIIVPYRDREIHLKIFVPVMKEFLKKEGTLNDILIVEQEKGKPFNRAKLLNIGVDFTNNSYDYYCFHDVDMLPIESDYTYCNEPTHLAAKAQQFNYKLPYQTYFGGVTIFDAASFRKINGYSNLYFGWGAEDDDIFLRCQKIGIKPNRKQGIYRSLSHERVIDQQLYQRNVEILRNGTEILDDGLNSLSYEITNKSVEEFYTKITVAI